MTKDNVSFEQQIKPFRDEIDDIDARIISLLSRRREQVEKIVAVKKEHKGAHLPPGPGGRRNLSPAGKSRCPWMWSPIFVEKPVQGRSCASPGKPRTHVSKTSPLRPQARVLVVGGAGEMGPSVCPVFRREPDTRWISWIKRTGTGPGRLCENADLVMVCVPIHVTVKVIEDLAPLMRPDAVLTEPDIHQGTSP